MNKALLTRFTPAILLAGLMQGQMADITGNWLGSLQAGPVTLRVAFHITADENGEFTSTLDSLDQNAMGIPVRRTTFSGNKLQMDIPGIRADYEGVLSADRSEIAGTFTQGGVPLPLTLKRVAKIEAPKRPQNPRPPFPYDSLEVSYENGEIRLGGTLTIPRGQGPFPAALMITGSGAQDRDESLMGHKPFLVIADYLTRRGIAVLRVDDRGVGKSTGSTSQETLDDMASDVLAGVGFLKGRTEIDAKHIGVIGHSKGGIVGPAAAVRSPDISFVIMLAGTGVSGDQVLYAQAELVARSMGATENAIERNRAIQQMILNVLKSENDPKAALAKMRAEWERMKADFPEAQQEAADRAMNQQFEGVLSPEMRSFILHDPAATLRHVKAPVLALNGSRDVQVSAKQNLPAIAAALAEGGNSDFTVTELPGLNHLFQKCDKCTVSEYGELEETFSPAALEVIGDWLALHMRTQ